MDSRRQPKAIKNSKKQLHSLLRRHFSLEELRTLCFNLDIDFEDLEGGNKEGLTRELILYSIRHGIENELIIELNEMQPKVRWPSLSPTNEERELVSEYYKLNQEAATISTVPFALEDILGYLILGMEPNASLVPIYRIFADTQLEKYDLPFTEIYFSDFEEMQDVFSAIQDVVSKAQSLEQTGISRSDAFLRSLKEASIDRVSEYLFSSQNQTSLPNTAKTGLRYLVWGVVQQYAEIIKLLRPKELLHTTLEVERNKEEIVFQNIETFYKASEVIIEAEKEAKGNTTKMLQILARESLRMRLLENK